MAVALIAFLVYKTTRPVQAPTPVVVAPAPAAAQPATAAAPPANGTPTIEATVNRAKLAGVKTDLRNAETAEEMYFSNFATYGTLEQLRTQMTFVLSTGATMSIVPATNGYTINGGNSSISNGITTCSVQVGAGASREVDGMIHCP